MASPNGVTISGSERVLKNIKALGPYAETALGKILYVKGEKVMARSKTLVPVYAGALRASGRTLLPKIERGSVTVSLVYGGAAKTYAVFIHEGTGPAVGRSPFRPPVEPFKLWAKRVLGDEKLAGAVAASVGRKGLKPRKYLEKPFLESVKGLDREVASGLARELKSFHAD